MSKLYTLKGINREALHRGVHEAIFSGFEVVSIAGRLYTIADRDDGLRVFKYLGQNGSYTIWNQIEDDTKYGMQVAAGFNISWLAVGSDKHSKMVDDKYILWSTIKPESKKVVVVKGGATTRNSVPGSGVASFDAVKDLFPEYGSSSNMADQEEME